MEKLRKHQGKIKVTQQKLRNLYELCEHPQGRLGIGMVPLV